jgi:hypothetical protein
MLPLRADGKKATGFIVYEGPSLIDGLPIVVIATISSKNVKTQNMVQTWVLRSDVDPVTANRTGQDYSICGACPLRGKAHNGPTGLAKDRACYVVIAQAPNAIYKAYKAGKYPVAAVADIVAIGEGRMVRIGAYGDGAAIPSYVWDMLILKALGHTGYTHQNKIKTADARPDLYMTSVASYEEAKATWAEGRRTFRVLLSVDEIDKVNEFLCPASKEAGFKSTCEECGLCNGLKSKTKKSPAIVVHGKGSNNFA